MNDEMGKGDLEVSTHHLYKGMHNQRFTGKMARYVGIALKYSRKKEV